uniref:Uncharacterized protein n=1 Tax=Arundo donax TaxID=35708 RepID=A0A0A9A4I7_ARUDO
MLMPSFTHQDPLGHVLLIVINRATVYNHILVFFLVYPGDITVYNRTFIIRYILSKA